MVAAETLSNALAGVGAAGIVACSAAYALYSKEEQVTTSVMGLGVAGAALIVAGFAKKRGLRGDGVCNLMQQTKFLDGTEEFVDAKDEEGKKIKVHCGPKGVLGLPLSERCGSAEVVVKPERCPKTGLIMSMSKEISTTYDLIFKGTVNDARPALGRCVKMHTFKDAMKDGKPNPKPSIVDTPGEWKTITHAEMKQQARAFGSFLRGDCGIGPKEKVSIWSGNCVEWLLADLACAAFNWTSVSVYDSLGPDAASFIVADSGSQVLVVEDKCFKKVPDLLEDDIYRTNPGKDLKVVVHLGKGDDATKAALEAKGLKVVAFSDTLKHALLPDTPPTKDDVVTIMYTSGTTGMPKGVMLSHINIVSTISMMDMTPSIELRADDVHLSYLPLAHIFERQNSLALLFKGATVNFASQGAKYLLADLSVIRPTLFAGVPKVYENVRDAVVRKMTGFKKTLFEAAMMEKIRDIETGCGYHPIWDALIFSKTKQALGGRVRFCVTGGAPISKDTLYFVICALAPVVQGYGATETSAASTLTMSFDPVIGAVGAPLGTSAIRLVDVPDMNYYSGHPEVYKDDPKAKACFESGRNKSGGEVWIGGPGVSKGYYDPSVSGLKKGVPSNKMAAKTKEDFFVEDGWSWFKTGDIGLWTANGCLKIVDRKKNMFKTSLGEYVPVEEVEKTYQDTCPYADFVFLPKETKVAYVAVCVVVSDSIGTVMKWAKDNGVPGDESAVVASDAFKELLFKSFEASAKEKKLQRFLWVAKKNIHAEYHAPGYQEDWVAGVVCKNGQKEQLLTATFKPRRAQLDQYFAPIFPKLYPDRPKDHILP